MAQGVTGRSAVRTAAAIVMVAAFVLLGGTAWAQTSVGGSSAGIGESGGGDGGSNVVISNPVATSGSTGDASASSSATNTGRTGDATSQAISNPVSSSGGSGGSGDQGGSTSNPTATNNGILGTAVAGGQRVSSNASDSSGGTGDAVAGSPAAQPAQAGPGTVAGPVTAYSSVGNAPSTPDLPATAGSSAAFQAPESDAGGFTGFSRAVAREAGGTQTANLVMLALGVFLAATLAGSASRLNGYWATVGSPQAV